jgi:hypothetical protein
VPVSQKAQGESAVYRSPDFKDKLYDRLEPHLATMKDMLINSYKKFANLPALGTNGLMQERSSRTSRESPPLSLSPTKRHSSARIRSAALLLAKGFLMCLKASG